jgi:hypothetical protein
MRMRRPAVEQIKIIRDCTAAGSVWLAGTVLEVDHHISASVARLLLAEKKAEYIRQEPKLEDTQLVPDDLEQQVIKKGKTK